VGAGLLKNPFTLWKGGAQNLREHIKKGVVKRKKLREASEIKNNFIFKKGGWGGGGLYIFIGGQRHQYYYGAANYKKEGARTTYEFIKMMILRGGTYIYTNYVVEKKEGGVH